MKQKVAFLTTIFPMKIEYLYDCFDSLDKQTYKNFDIIVVNDGYENFEEFDKKYINLNLIELKYTNTPAKNREYGINYAIDNNYDVLIFGDSDDYFLENRIEQSIDLLKNYDIVVNDLSIFDENGIYENKYISNRIRNNTIVKYEYIMNKNIFGLSNTAINLKILSKLEIDKDVTAVDWFLYKQLLKENNKAIFTNRTITYYRQHSNNTVGLNNKDNKYPLWWEII